MIEQPATKAGMVRAVDRGEGEANLLGVGKEMGSESSIFADFCNSILQRLRGCERERERERERGKGEVL